MGKPALLRRSNWATKTGKWMKTTRKSSFAASKLYFSC
jgi:hypothetical protein